LKLAYFQVRAGSLGPHGQSAQAQQCRTTFGDFDQKHTSGDVLVLKSLVAEGLLELVKLHQFHGQRALQERVSVKLDRVMIERCVHFRDRAAMIRGNASDAFLDDLVVIHGTSLPLMLGLANTNAALEVVDDRAQVLD